MRLGPIKFSVKSWAVCACACFAGGIVAGIVGSVLTSLSWIIGAEVHPWVRAVGTVLLILTIPLLILAGHCLDRLERTVKAKPLTYSPTQHARQSRA